MAKKRVKKSIDKITKFAWTPKGAINWVLNETFDKFVFRLKYAPIAVLLEEHGYLREAQGCLIEQHKGETKNYYDNPKRKDLQIRIEFVEEKIMAKYYGLQDAIERMDYYDSLEARTKQEKTEEK
jgi:hypothetical protein